MGLLSRHKGQLATKVPVVIDLHTLEPWPSPGALEVRWQRGSTSGKTKPVQAAPMAGQPGLVSYAFGQSVRLTATFYQARLPAALPPHHAACTCTCAHNHALITSPLDPVAGPRGRAVPGQVPGAVLGQGRGQGQGQAARHRPGPVPVHRAGNFSH